MKRTYNQLPAIINNYPLDTYEHGWFGVVVPQARTNIARNPSVETNLTNYAAVTGSIARSLTYQYFGAYSLEVTPTAATGTGALYGSAYNDIALVSGTTYALSVYWKGQPGITYAFGVRTTGGILIQETTFVATGEWQRITMFYTETATNTRYLYFTKVGTNASVFYLDGLQCEACGSEGNFHTTYIDGDQLGLVPNQFPPAYIWTGTPHASASTRSGQTRAGGRVMKFSTFSFLLTAIIGLGLVTPEHASIPYSLLDGAQYQRTRFPPRQFTLTGQLSGRTPRELQQQRRDLLKLFSRETIATEQPLVLTYQAYDGDGAALTPPAQITAIYQDGGGGNADNLFAESIPITFTQHLPFITTQGDGAVLDTQDSVSVNGLIRKQSNGVWDSVGGGVTGASGQVKAIVEGLDGTIYIGGDFTDGGGTGADYLVAYNPNTGTYSAVGSTTAMTGTVNALAVAANGSIIIGGNFLNANGIAAADYIVRYTPGTGYAAIGASGANNTINTVFVAQNGDIYAGGAFTDIGGSGADFGARFDGSSWNVLQSATALSASVAAFVQTGSDTIIVGGSFLNAGGVADADNIAIYTPSGNAFSALVAGGAGGSTVQTLALAPNGLLYIAGGFTTIGGVTANYAAVWNGTSMAPLAGATSISSTVNELIVLQDGSILFGGLFTSINGIPIADRIARFSGGAFTLIDTDLPGALEILALFQARNGDIYIGFDTTGTATASGITTVTNTGTARAYPTIIFRAVANAGGRVYQVSNLSTNKTIYFNYTIQDGETLTLTLQPDNISFVSTFRGNIISAILPGSNDAEFFLQRGENRIAVYTADADTAATIQWVNSYESLDDLVLAP